MKITSAADINTQTVSGLLMVGAGASSAGAASAAAGAAASVGAVARAGVGAASTVAASVGAATVSAAGAGDSCAIAPNPVPRATQHKAARLMTCSRVFHP